MADSVNPPTRNIFARIQNATDHELRTVLSGLCADEATRKEAMEMFSRLEKLKGGDQPPTTLHICLNCKASYSAGQNTSDACRYHPGVVDINHESEAWEDCDPWQIYDDDEMREEHPEGFMWTCCYKPLDTAGCKPAFHQQGGAKAPAASPSLPADEKGGNKRARRS
ncbi:uncharacterized protein B0H64DRAFT_468909 [Chaetomium fimeti]|uniref:C2H2-type domain-containing protein n=1 Tax=Chaetomium fimeti TaxID=1854472 RepID=A0AAE0LNI4_9PEZI|nr:hypothetical protein B0H64DRAFT_468909 [Chaetomium fimeti]